MDAEGLLSNELRQVRRRNMFVLLSTTLAIVGTRFLWWQVLPLHLRSLGATDAQVGTVFTVMLLLGPMQLVGGLVSDQMGRRYAIAIPSLALAPALIGGVLARHWLWMGLSVWFIGVIAAVQQPGFQALLAESATDSDRGRVFGTFYMTTAMASLLGPAAGAALLPVIGIRGLIGINAGSALAAGLARLLLLREGPFVAVAARSGAIPARLILRNRTMRRLIIVNSLYLLLLSLTTQGPFVALHAADSLAMQAQAILVLFTAGGIGALPVGVDGAGMLVDYSQGPLEATDRPLDLAIVGEGFFRVLTPDGERLTRNGVFQRDANGNLCTPEGYYLLGEDGPIQIGAGSIIIVEDGHVYLAGETEPAARIALGRVANLGALEADQNGLLDPENAGLELAPAGETILKQGFLEQANVDASGTLVGMMMALRSYEAAQRSFRLQDETLRGLLDAGRAV